MTDKWYQLMGLYRSNALYCWWW